MRLVLTYDIPQKITKKNRSSYILEHRIEVVHSIQKALEGMGHEVAACLSDLNLGDNLIKIQPQMAFNNSVRMHDGNEGAYAPFLLERMKIPFTGSSAGVCANAFDKSKAKKILEKAGIQTPKFLIIKNGEDIRIPDSLTFPVFVKPVKGGCSKGIRKENLITRNSSYVKDIQRIYQRIGEPLLVAEFMPGREFSVGILGNEHPQILPIEEFHNAKGRSEIPFRSFTRKMIDYEEESYTCPANLSPKEQIDIGKLAVNAFKCMGCRDYARVDIRLDIEGTPNILDINVLPSLVPGESAFALMAQEAGISFKDLIRKLLVMACHRSHLSYDELIN